MFGLLQKTSYRKDTLRLKSEVLIQNFVLINRIGYTVCVTKFKEAPQDVKTCF